MKKLLVLLGILAAFSFVACNKEAGGSDSETNIENEDTGDNGAVEDEGTTGGDSTEDEGSTGGDSTEDEGNKLVTEVLFEEFVPYSSQIPREKLEECFNKSTGDAKLVLSYEFNDAYTPTSYDGVGVIHTWDSSWNDYEKFTLNLGEDVSSKEGTIEYLIKDILDDEKIAYITADPWKISSDDDSPKKLTFTKVSIVYTAK